MTTAPTLPSDTAHQDDIAPVPEPAARRRLRRWREPKVLILTVVVVVIAYVALVPLVYLLWGTFVDGTGLTLDAFRRAFSATGLGAMTWNTLLFSLGAMVVSIVAGAGLAYLTERTNVPFKGLIYAGALVPLVIPGILYTIAWIFLAGPRTGVLSQWFESVFGTTLGVDVFTLPGMIVVQGLDSAPLAFLLMVAAFRAMDPALEEAALMAGARRTTVLRRVTLPLGLPGLLAAVLVMTVRNVEAFETPALLGMPSDIWVFTTRIYRILSYHPVDYGQAGAYALTLLLATSLAVYIQTRMTSGARKYQTVTGKGFRPRMLDLGPWRWPAAVGVLAYTLVAVALPVLMLVFMSTQPFNRAPTWENIRQASLENYATVFASTGTMKALVNSAVLAVGAATVIMLLAAIAAWLVIRTRLPGRWLLDNLTFLPLVIPGLVLGVALLFTYLRSPLPVYGTMWILLIAYVTRFLPYGMRYASSSMYQIANELEESALVSGASWWQTFRRIVLPLLTPGLVAGWIYVVIVAIRELSASLLLYSAGNEVLSIEIWQLWQDGKSNVLAALGVVVVAAMSLVVFVARRLGAGVGYEGR